MSKLALLIAINVVVWVSVAVHFSVMPLATGIILIGGGAFVWFNITIIDSLMVRDNR